MSITNIIYSAVATFSVMAVIIIVFRKRPRKLKNNYFQAKWLELQAMLADKTLWAEAIVQADKLLDEALKKKRCAGKSMGERLVSAQRMLSDNDGAWYGHKLKKQLEQHPDLKLRKNDVKDALLGLRQALKDLGALL
jgi:hypothetical protein